MRAVTAAPRRPAAAAELDARVPVEGRAQDPLRRHAAAQQLAYALDQHGGLAAAGRRDHLHDAIGRVTAWRCSGSSADVDPGATLVGAGCDRRRCRETAASPRRALARACTGIRRWIDEVRGVSRVSRSSLSIATGVPQRSAGSST